MAGKRKAKGPTKAQKRWTRMSDIADREKEPFRKGSMSMRVIREQQRNSRKSGEYGDNMRTGEHVRKGQYPGSPYARGYFERPDSVIKAHDEDRRNVAKRDSSRAIDSLKRGKSLRSSGRR